MNSQRPNSLDLKEFRAWDGNDLGQIALSPYGGRSLLTLSPEQIKIFQDTIECLTSPQNLPSNYLSYGYTQPYQPHQPLNTPQISTQQFWTQGPPQLQQQQQQQQQQHHHHHQQQQPQQHLPLQASQQHQALAQPPAILAQQASEPQQQDQHHHQQQLSQPRAQTQAQSQTIQIVAQQQQAPAQKSKDDNVKPALERDENPTPIGSESVELEKLRRKRERNRRAAANCRRRKDEKLKKLEDENMELQKIIENLRSTIENLKSALENAGKPSNLSQYT